MERMSLEDVLSDKEPEKEEVAETTETVEEAPEERLSGKALRKAHRKKELEAQGRDPETGQFAPKEEVKEEEPKPEVKVEVKEQPKVEMTEKEKGLLRAAEEERRKRQDLERRIAELEKPKTETTEKKSFWDDPESHLKATEQSVDQKLSQKELNIILRTSEMIARSRYKDFDEKIEVFAGDLKTVPGLHAQWLASQDPAEFAYKYGEKTKLMKDVGSIEEYKLKIEKDLRVKLEAEYKAKEEEFKKQRAALPGSLSDVRGAAKQHQPVFTGPIPMEDILKP